MRLDSRKGDHGWQCFDVERCVHVKGVIWVDDESATWGELDKAATVVTGRTITITHREKRIRIVAAQRMVLFNPLPDSDVRDSEELPVLRDVVVEHKQGQRA